METFLFQNWTTLKGPSIGTSSTVVQAPQEWLDIERYRDVVPWLQITEATVGTGTFSLDTAPSASDGLFASVVSFIGGTGVTVVGPIVVRGAATPPTRFIRWSFKTPQNVLWSITFRMWIVANPAREGA